VLCPAHFTPFPLKARRNSAAVSFPIHLLTSIRKTAQNSWPCAAHFTGWQTWATSWKNVKLVAGRSRQSEIADRRLIGQPPRYAVAAAPSVQENDFADRREPGLPPLGTRNPIYPFLRSAERSKHGSPVYRALGLVDRCPLQIGLPHRSTDSSLFGDHRFCHLSTGCGRLRDDR
jgi:hypothetical protein